MREGQGGAVNAPSILLSAHDKPLPCQKEEGCKIMNICVSENVYAGVNRYVRTRQYWNCDELLGEVLEWCRPVFFWGGGL